MNDNRDELESLISRSGDPTLSPRERRALESALRAHPYLSESADQYRRLSDLLARRSAEGAAVDWNELRARLRTAIAEDSQRRLTESLDRADHGGEPAGPAFDATDAATKRDRARYVQLDHLLSRYAEDRPGVDYAALSARIRAAVLREASRDRPARGRWGDAVWPVAIAASLLLAVSVWRGQGPTAPIIRDGAIINVPAVFVRLDVPPRGGVVWVEFDRQPPVRDRGTVADAARGSGIVSGRADTRSFIAPIIESHSLAVAF